MNSQLKDKTKQKKFKPIKIPAKSQVPNLLQASKKQDFQTSKISENNKLKSKIPLSNRQQKKLRTKEAVCNQLLKQGNIQSFIDMFYISHKILPNMMQNKNYFGEIIISAQTQDLNQSDILFLNQLSTNLKKAEASSYYNHGDKENAMNEYNGLAYTYENQGDYITAAYFYNKVIELAKISKNKQYEVVAMIGMGKCFDQQKNTEKAIQIFEQSLNQSQQIQNLYQKQNIIKLISKDLIEIYLKIAEQNEKIEGNHQFALKYFEKCLLVAQKANQKDSQGLICYKIGQLYYKISLYKKSVEYQQKYLQVAKYRVEQSKNIEEGKEKNEINLKTKVMEAHASLSKCYLKMKQIGSAEIHLNQYNQLAKQLKIQNSLADSSYYLAKLYEQKGNNTKAIQFYKAYFEAAKSQRPQKKNRNLVDKARVTYALSKGNQNIEKFIKIFNSQNNLKQILDWKMKKQIR